MLLRNRSRAMKNPGLMADHSSQPSPKQNYARAIPSLFGSPKFGELTSKCVSGTEALRSPTSILDTRALSPFGINPLSYEAIASPNKSSCSWDKTDSKGIGLALLDALQDDQIKQKSAKGNVLFGTQLRLKIPQAFPVSPSRVSPFETQTCSTDFGLKTKDSLQSPSGCENSGIYTGVVSLSEMELCEEYTCVKSHGPNPRTTHIFNNCIVNAYPSTSFPHNSHSAFGTNFLSSCYTCKMQLDHTKDIFIYRGEKAFCSRECRHREMVLDGAEASEFDSNGDASL